MLRALIIKEWLTSLLELRFLVCAALCVVLGIVSVNIHSFNTLRPFILPPLAVWMMALPLQAGSNQESPPSSATAALPPF